MVKKYNVAILGATGTVGQAMISILAEQHFPIKKLYPLASHRSKGQVVSFQGQHYPIIAVEDFDFSTADIALFSAGSPISAQYAPIAAKAGCVVIDNTSHFRQVPDIPLVIPEVNPEQIQDYKKHYIIANPNCSTIQMLVALKPIYDAVGIARINVITYQSVSGAGRRAIEELESQSWQVLKKQAVTCEVLPTQIAFNVIPQIGAFEPNGYTLEEMKMVYETQKILGDDTIKVNPTTVRVPVFYGHSEAIHIETKTKLSAKEATQLLKEAKGVIVKDTHQDSGYPTPAIDAMGKDAVFVGRIREDLSHPFGLNLWVVADNIRKGAALNSVQIAQILIGDYLYEESVSILK